jgi:hypothetical protein
MASQGKSDFQREKPVLAVNTMDGVGAVAGGDDAEEVAGLGGGEGIVAKFVAEEEVWLEVAAQGTAKGGVGLRGVEIFEHVGGSHAEHAVAGQTGGVRNGFSDACFAGTGLTEAEDVAVLGDKAAGYELVVLSWSDHSKSA